MSFLSRFRRRPRFSEQRADGRPLPEPIASDQRFHRRRKMRFISDPPTDREDWSGPGVSRFSWCHGLKDCDWFEIRNSSLAQCIADDVVPCVSGGSFGTLKQCEEKQWPLCIFPNTAFNDSGSRWKDAAYFLSPWTQSLLLLNDEDLNPAWQLTNDKFRGAIARVRHFLRPHVYESDLYVGPQRWDVLFYLKSKDCHLEHVRRLWPNMTMLQNGFFTYEELRYKAQRSRFCIVGSSWDSYGLALHEIAAEGCPVLTCDPGTLPGNFAEGKQGLYLRNEPNPTLMGSDLKELAAAGETVLSWKRRDVREATLAFADPALLRPQWKAAVYGDAPEHRIKPAPKPLAYCFEKGKYLPRLEAKCIREDIEKGFYHG